MSPPTSAGVAGLLVPAGFSAKPEKLSDAVPSKHALLNDDLPADLSASAAGIETTGNTGAGADIRLGAGSVLDRSWRAGCRRLG